MTDKPNPERVYAVIAAILERRYNVTIEYTLHKKDQAGDKNEPGQGGNADAERS